MARPGIEPRTSDLQVRCPTDCATRPDDLFVMICFVYNVLLFVCINVYFVLKRGPQERLDIV